MWRSDNEWMNKSSLKMLLITQSWWLHGMLTFTNHAASLLISFKSLLSEGERERRNLRPKGTKSSHLKRFKILHDDKMHFTYRRSAFLGTPFGTVFRPRPWQSTCDPEQLHLCGHPLTEVAHSSSARTRAKLRQSAARLLSPVGSIIST